MMEPSASEIKKMAAKQRSGSSVGSRQGDHVSAYALFKECFLNKCLEGSLNFEESIELLISIITKYAHEEINESIFSEYRARIKENPHFLIPEEEERIAKALASAAVEEDLVGKSVALMKMGNQSVLKSFLDNLIENHYTLRNKLEFTSFPQEGNMEPLPGEGARVKKAISFLRAEEKKKNINVKDTVSNIKELFWFPEIPQNVLLDKESERWVKICRNKYRKGTEPRSNDPGILCQVLENHLSLIFSCYPSFHNYQSDIVDGFIELVLRGWSSIKGDEFKKMAVRETVSVNLDAVHGFFEEDPQRGAYDSKRSSSILPSEEKEKEKEKEEEEEESESASDDSSPFSALDNSTPLKQKQAEEKETKLIEQTLSSTRGTTPVTYEETYKKICSKSSKKRKKHSENSVLSKGKQS